MLWKAEKLRFLYIGKQKIVIYYALESRKYIVISPSTTWKLVVWNRILLIFNTNFHKLDTNDSEI